MEQNDGASIEENAFALAEGALADSSYDPFARAEGRGLPDKTIDIYWDEQAAQHLIEFDARLSEQQNRVAIFNASLANVDALKDLVSPDDPDRRAKLSKIAKAKREDAKQAALELEKFNEMEAEREKWLQPVLDSRVQVNLAGYDGDTTDAIHKRLNERFPSIDGKPNPLWADNYTFETIAAAIQWTQRADEDQPNYQKISPTVVAKWRKTLPEDSWLKLVQSTAEVALATGLFKSLEDAGFLARS